MWLGGLKEIGGEENSWGGGFPFFQGEKEVFHRLPP